jgi:membrane-bound serine protease (ClpP class)
VQLATALAVSIPLGLITAFLMSIALRARRGKVSTGIEGLIGEVGVARTPVAASGKVFVHGEIWDAVSQVPVSAGSPVRVRTVHDFQLEVEPVASEPPSISH